MNVCEIIERETGQVVTLDTPIEDLQVDSLEYIDLMLTLGLDSNGHYETVGDLQRKVA